MIETADMNWLVYLFGSGATFFLGVLLVLLSLAAFAVIQHPWLKVPATLLAVIGLIVIAFSATPLPYWLYALAGGVTLLWLVAERSRRGWLPARRGWLRAAAAAVWVAAAAVEVPYHLVPTVAAADHPTLYILGDSVAAGVGDRQETWPHRLARTHPVEVADFSRVGATVASALRQADGLPADGGLVLLEIGGNDLLGSTTAAEFERGLDQLLGWVCAPRRTVLMFELPLPPFCNEFGRAQRRLAARYGVRLIPKRIFLAVLTGEGTTLDSLHLAREGHERMADAVWDLIGPVYGG